MSNKLSRSKNVGAVCLGILLIFIIGFLLGYFRSSMSSDEVGQNKWEVKEYHSETASEDCVICKTKKEFCNEDNVGILFLNSGTVNRVQINKYNKNGQLITKEDTYTQTMTGLAYGENLSLTIESNGDRGYANVDINLGKEKEFDIAQAVENCCENCIKSLVEDYYSVTPYDVAVLNYKTGDIELVTPNTRAFSLGDFYISCVSRSTDGEKEISELDLLIFYCPNRYGDD